MAASPSAIVKSTYQEDVPAENLQFDFGVVATSLATLLQRKSVGATVVGIHGPWGSGKTTMLRAVRDELKKSFPEGNALFIDFNAWKYQDRQALWRALILRVLGELRASGVNEPKLGELEASLYRSFSVEEKGPWQVNWRTLIIELIGMALSLVKLDFIAEALKKSTGFFGRMMVWATGGDKEKKKSDKDGKDDDKKNADDAVLNKERVEKLGSVLERATVQRQVQQVQSIEQFLPKFAELLGQPATLKQSADSNPASRRVFMFIDDLDRCLPESALEIFEAIKLFLDVTGCGYVIALDRDVIRKALLARYSQQAASTDGLLINSDEYIEKTISVSYDLPRLSKPDVLSLITSFQLSLDLDTKHEELIIAGLGRNPRRVRRFMNTLSLYLQIARRMHERGLPVDPCLLELKTPEAPRRFDYFLKLSLLAYRYSALFSVVLQEEAVLSRLETAAIAYARGMAEKKPDARKSRNDALGSESSILVSLKSAEEFWALMASAPNLANTGNLWRPFLTWFRREPPEQGVS